MIEVTRGSSTIYTDDIDRGFATAVAESRTVAWDIETSGLDWKTERIGTCQLFIPGGLAAIVKVKRQPPRGLITILNDPNTIKIFHHAMFDLRFMTHAWGASPRNIADTKIASKLLDPS